jgi:Cysteine rich repeat
MHKPIIGSIVVAAVLLIGGQAKAADSLADSLKKACNKELTTFCKGVPAGEGRILACLYAFEDKVSDKCMYALYDASAQLKDAIVALDYAATQCKDDLQKFCANVQPGEGRALACIQKNQKSASQPCKDALQQTGLWKK